MTGRGGITSALRMARGPGAQTNTTPCRRAGSRIAYLNMAVVAHLTAAAAGLPDLEGGLPGGSLTIGGFVPKRGPDCSAHRTRARGRHGAVSTAHPFSATAGGIDS